MFKIHSKYKPTGDQPTAIKTLVDGINKGLDCQTLLGVTGSGKTFTIANVIEQVQKPTIIMAHNKLLLDNYIPNSKKFFQKMLLSTSYPITIVIKNKPEKALFQAVY